MSSEDIVGWYRDTARDGLAGDGVRFLEPLGAWVVHGHAEVDRVLTDHRVFSSDELRYSARPVPHRDNPVLGSLAAIDPPRHHLLRRLVSRAFTPRAVAALLPSITDTVRTQLAGVDGELDVIGRLGCPLPVRTIAALLGVEPARQPDFVRWTEAITTDDELLNFCTLLLVNGHETTRRCCGSCRRSAAPTGSPPRPPASPGTPSSLVSG